MKNAIWIVTLTISLAGCGAPAPSDAPATTPAATDLKQQPYATLAQVMRALPFTSANIIFDTQTQDPEAKPTGEHGDLATTRYAAIYKGWPLVEQSALALAETANLLMIPGRMCENGRPAPLDQEDYRKWVLGLADAGKKTLEAAKTKNQDKMIEVTETVTEACRVCHERYRDTEDPKDRCDTSPAAAAK